MASLRRSSVHTSMPSLRTKVGVLNALTASALAPHVASYQPLSRTAQTGFRGKQYLQAHDLWHSLDYVGVSQNYITGSEYRPQDNYKASRSDAAINRTSLIDGTSHVACTEHAITHYELVCLQFKHVVRAKQA